jgi:hypothetical protein
VSGNVHVFHTRVLDCGMAIHSYNGEPITGAELERRKQAHGFSEMGNVGAKPSQAPITRVVLADTTV